MKLLNVRLGLLFGFHKVKRVDGISRLVLPDANKPSTEGNEGNEERDTSPNRRLDMAQKRQNGLDNGRRLSPPGPVTEGGRSVILNPLISLQL
jgi:hypothetical protein